MNNLLLSNIKESFRIIAEEKPRVPEHLIEIIDERDNTLAAHTSVKKESIASGLAEHFARCPIQALPLFYWDSTSKLQSHQQSFFGYYLVRNALRGIFMCLNFIKAGDLLQGNNFFAVSTYSFYTASFHLLHSFLALNGRIVIEPVFFGPIKVIKREESSECTHGSLNPSVKVIIALHTKKNEWKFETRTRSHIKRWKELEPILMKKGSNIPNFFLSLFKYVMSHGGLDLSDKHNLVKYGIERLTEIRHESIYKGFGYDDVAHNMIINRDLDSICRIDLRSESYRDFAIGLLNFCINEVLKIKNHINRKHWCEVRAYLISSIITPPFEKGSFDIFDQPNMNKALEIIWSWLSMEK